jgi:alcohol dehydrogenase (NADP+)
MPILRFKNNDLMPALGLGTWKSEPGKVYTAVKDALQAGYRHIDCAPIYGNEAEIGKALEESFQSKVISRSKLWITSKLWNNSHAPEDVQPALERTLADLKLQYLDLFLIHWPVHIVKDQLYASKPEHYIAFDRLPIIETWKVMEALVEKGLCRHIGVSNFSITKLALLMENSRLKPEMNQIELHPYLQQHSMLEYCHNNDIHLTAYSPLGSSDRPAALKAADEPVLLEDPMIARIAEHHGVTSAQVLISWAINRGTAVIPKSVNSARIIQNLEARNLTLTKADMDEINTLDRNRRYVSGEFWAPEGSPYNLANIWDE